MLSNKATEKKGRLAKRPASQPIVQVSSSDEDDYPSIKGTVSKGR